MRTWSVLLTLPLIGVDIFTERFADNPRVLATWREADGSCTLGICRWRVMISRHRYNRRD